MSIKKRLFLSNIAMIFVPVLCFFILEIILGYVLFVVFKGNPEGTTLKWFLSIRFIGIALILIVTNGLLTFFVSKSIIRPMNNLSHAAKEISEGNLDAPIRYNAKDEIGRLAETFDLMRINLKQSQEAQAQYEENRKTLIANISHDLKTPLTSIKGYVKGIQDGVADTPEKLDRYTKTIYQKANDLDELIDELFLYSKLDLESIPLQLEQIDLYAFFKDYLEALAFDLENVTVRFLAKQNEAFIIQADREQLKRAVTNITQNNLKYMDKEQQEIQVYLHAETDYVQVSIHDNGSGISESDLPFIFDSFYRPDRSRNSTTGGSGLGLAIVKKIIEEHDGTIWIESKSGVGTTIHFTLKKV